MTTGIVLTRTEFGEADRILTIITPEYGKLRIMARGVRRIKSKLAGGIELFSVSNITFIRGRGEICTLISSRLQKNYASIVQDIKRTMLGYDLIKLLNRSTEDETEPAYFHLMKSALEALDDPMVSSELISTWFSAQLLKLAGHSPDLKTDDTKQELKINSKYNFNFESMAFKLTNNGRFTSNHIKLLRLLFSDNRPHELAQIQENSKLMSDLNPAVQTMLKTHIRI